MGRDTFECDAWIGCHFEDDQFGRGLADAEPAECFSDLPVSMTSRSQRHEAYVVIGTECEDNLRVNVPRLQPLIEIVVHGSPGCS